MQCTVLIRKSLPQRRSQLMDLMEKGAYFTDLLTDSESLALKKDAFAKLPQGSMLIDEEGHLLLHHPTACDGDHPTADDVRGQHLFSLQPLKSLGRLHQSWLELKKQPPQTQRILSYRFTCSWGIRDMRIRMVLGQHSRCWISIALLHRS